MKRETCVGETHGADGLLQNALLTSSHASTHIASRPITASDIAVSSRVCETKNSRSRTSRFIATNMRLRSASRAPSAHRASFTDAEHRAGSDGIPDGPFPRVGRYQGRRAPLGLTASARAPPAHLKPTPSPRARTAQKWSSGHRPVSWPTTSAHVGMVGSPTRSRSTVTPTRPGEHAVLADAVRARGARRNLARQQGLPSFRQLKHLRLRQQLDAMGPWS